MTRRRWIADRVAGNRAWLIGANAEHLARVLRARPGQQFDVAADGVLCSATVTAVSPNEVEFELGERISDSPLPHVEVLLSVFKFDRFEWAIEKLTELGIAKIVPVISRRTDAHLVKAAEKRLERWRRIALESAQQARRLAPPEIGSPISLKVALQDASGCRIVLSEIEETVSLKAALKQCQEPVVLAFGPEGGWTQEELDSFQTAGWKSASLGSTVLRAETAAIAAVAVVMAEVEAE
jgi:16S rRNA (uracil1498-N3)-methyltransferase